jgi:hypothetical protein
VIATRQRSRAGEESLDVRQEDVAAEKGLDVIESWERDEGAIW